MELATHPRDALGQCIRPVKVGEIFEYFVRNIENISEYIKVIFKPLTGNETAISTLTKEERYVKTLTNRISKKIISANSLSEEKAKKVIAWVNKELVKWSKDDDDEINTIEGRKKKIKSLTKKGIKKFK